MGAVGVLAEVLGAEERTLRRAASQGTLRCTRRGPRRLLLTVGEREYLEGHWALLAALRQSLRTEHRVRLAVLYGSVARGDEDVGSDLDLLVLLRGGHPSDTAGLAMRLGRVAGRRADVAHLERVEAKAPLLLERILDEGRVLVDRDGLWPRLRKRRRAIHARARRAYRRQMAGARNALAELSA